MAKTSLDAARHFRGNYEHQKNFLHNVREWYYDLRREVVPNPPFRRSVERIGGHHLELLHVEYRRGVLSGWLACPYYEFEDYILRSLVWRYPEPKRLRRRSDDGHGTYYRDGNKYRKSVAHEKKEREPDLWRERFARDRSRHGYWFSGSRCRDHAKSLQNRRQRHTDRMRIAKGKWEDFEIVKKDKWMWD